ncbi:helix-turn-helix domain-containing protein [Cohnella zeiphila]|uniref:Helix-turn-helix transcriptional regulator n=1 Tax=Cohnella zeiphila TaxID=2761120 RepID=A0A7X0VTD2_9BACL|nr:helix-turn-helix transcriptional regulator [Cohnella zeiphila]
MFETGSVQPYFENNKNRAGGFEYPFYAAEVDAGSLGYEVGSHWHYHMEMLYFAEGTADVLAGSRTIRAEEGDLILIAPCCVHAVTVAPGQISRHRVISLEPDLLSPMPALFTNVKYMLPYSADASIHFHANLLRACGLGDLPRQTEELLMEYKRKQSAFELTVTSAIYRLLARLVRAMPELGMAGDESASGQEKDRLRLRETLAYIDEHSHEPLTASRMARLSLMSYSHFAASFKRMTRAPFSSYLQFVRVRKAERLLLDPALSITQIALETGFNDSSYFIKHFRRIRGMTPLQYRKMVLK